MTPARPTVDVDGLTERAEQFLVQCGACDAGLPMGCACHDGDPRPVIADLLAHLAAVTAERDEAANHLHEYDRRISWDTTCENCANLLDKSYAEYVRAEQAEAERDEATAAVDRVRAALRVNRVKGGVSCGGPTVDSEGCFAADLARRVTAALDRVPATEGGEG